MCSHVISLLAKHDVFYTKKCSHNLPWKISEIFDLFSFFPVVLAKFDVFCKKKLVKF